jgi:radical SAM protein with 4Fe4S-binding SPASM domain
VRAIYDLVKPFPRVCVWEITARCNLRCLHCASSAGPASVRGSELDGPRALRLCAELAEAGCEYVALSGGEALLRPDWRELAGRLRELGVAVGMISNGLLVTPAIADQMAHLGVSILAISIDGLGPTHDAIRRRSGSFRAALAALDRGARAGLRVHAITHVNRMNEAELEPLHEILETAGVATWLVQLSAPMGRMADRRDLVLAPDDLPDLTRRLADLKQRSRLYLAVGDNVGYFGECEAILRRKRPDLPLPFWCGCTAGLLTVGIEANGNVRGCLSIQADGFVEGNLNQRSFREIWNAPGAFPYTRGFQPKHLRGGCRSCEFGEICRGGCTFMAVAASGHPHDNPYCLQRLGRGRRGRAALGPNRRGKVAKTSQAGRAQALAKHST